MSSTSISESSLENGRRVVTAIGADDGKSKIAFDDTKGHVWTLPNGSKFQYLWRTDKVPVDLSSKAHQLEDPTSGVKGPGFDMIPKQGTVAGFFWMKPGGKSPLHTTHTLDYGLLMEGELELELDGGEKTVLRPGDVIIVQRQTHHSWRNPHATQWNKMFFVLVASTAAVPSG